MKVIRDVAYRHFAGYLRIVGRTKQSADRHTKAVGTALLERLPAGTEVKPGRYKGIQDGVHVFEVPVFPNRPKVRAVLADLVLRGEP